MGSGAVWASWTGGEEVAEMDDVEAEFRNLERETEVETELKTMKEKMKT